MDKNSQNYLNKERKPKNYTKRKKNCEIIKKKRKKREIK